MAAEAEQQWCKTPISRAPDVYSLTAALCRHPMAAQVVRAGSDGGQASVKRVLDVVILYEDFDTALRAKHSLDLPRDQLSLDSGWGTKLWRLDLPGEPALAERAAMEAAAADVIIMSLRGRRRT